MISNRRWSHSYGMGLNVDQCHGLCFVAIRNEVSNGFEGAESVAEGEHYCMTIILQPQLLDEVHVPFRSRLAAMCCLPMATVGGTQSSKVIPRRVDMMELLLIPVLRLTTRWK